MILASGELITDYTLGCEQKTQNATGIPINQTITMNEARMYGGYGVNITPELERKIRRLNQDVRIALNGFIAYKRKVLSAVLSCDLFTVNYPLSIEHILREAELYSDLLTGTEQGDPPPDLSRTEVFWNRDMLEHSLFIRGMLDPSENDLVRKANDFALNFAELQKQSQQGEVTDKILAETIELRDFKQTCTDGIARCKIRSIIPPLLADHVLREANRYIRLLRE